MLRRSGMYLCAAVGKLFSVASAELQEEQGRQDVPRVDALKAPEGWKLEQQEGEQLFKLVKEFNGERITATAIANGPDENIDFEFVVQKGQEALLIQALFEGEDMTYDSIMYVPDYADLDKESEVVKAERLTRRYHGPKLTELNQDLTDAMIKFLEERGLTDELGVFMTQYAAALEQKEYEGWLKGVISFSKQE